MAMADQQYDNELSGVLFKNDQKGNEKAPWYKGKIQIEGQEYELAAWLRESKAGNKFLSLKASIKSDQDQRQGRETPPSNGSDDDLPF
jgi:hypothetical protein